MNEKHLYILLKVIKNNTNVLQLVREGLSFSKIADLMSSSIKDGYIERDDNKVFLSEEGLNKFKALDSIFKKTNKKEWIKEDSKHKIPKLDKNSLFLPSQNELSF